ncbi:MULTISPECIES: class F sortase [unclassified Micromonospora]|uniref:class F sortase n=1 Tax=unclassified Micromonospora TaxID=2617518 RepID=UPI0022B6759A|nr:MULTISPECIES: class F sortase [unclassified Micromonospora]MCZ7418579.1 class F sortase [Verrucosispora sp. WMMA2121]WBB92290.1 class F sortase [Verrucosispora sp. WMMC514]
MAGFRVPAPEPGPGPRRTGRRGRRAWRRTVAAAGRLVRVAAQVGSASVATPDPAAAPLPPRRRPTRAVGTGRSGHSGPGLPVLVIGSLMLLIIAMLGVERMTGLSVLPDRFIAGLAPPPRKFPLLAASEPVGIEINKIDLAAPVHNVGIAPDGSIAAPPAERAQEAGWYDQGPTPGQYGPAVIVGHVDTTTGPAVFHQLPQLRAGDRVEVARSDGSVAIFEVDRVDRFGKERLPTDDVFGDFSRPQLRLITCGGRWVGGETGYADNVVVFASLVEAR